MALNEWELQTRLSTVLPLSDGELNQILTHVDGLGTGEACIYFNDLLGDSPEALKFIEAFRDSRSSRNPSTDQPRTKMDPPAAVNRQAPPDYQADEKSGANVQHGALANGKNGAPPPQTQRAPSYAPPPGRPPIMGPPPGAEKPFRHNHTNPVIEAARIRAQDEVCICQQRARCDHLTDHY